MSEYEFTAEQNRMVQSLSLHIRITAIMLAIFGLLWLIPINKIVNDEGINALLSSPQPYSMILFFVMAFLVWRVSPYMQRIITTQGKDISELLGGMRALDNLNNIGRILLGVGVVFMALRILV